MEVSIREASNLVCSAGAPTLAMLEGLVLGIGLGLGAFMLFLLAAAGSAPMETLAAPGLKLLGLAGFFVGAGFAAGTGATMVAIMGLTNMP